MWFIWDKMSNINTLTANEFLAYNKHLADEKVIYIKIDNEKIVQVEGKSILARAYKIDETLEDNDFILAYEQKLTEKELTLDPESFDPYAGLI